MPDWIDTFMDRTAEIRSPASFRLWTGIAIIAAVLERRVWTITDAPDPLRPNLYSVLTGTPASGKSIMVSIARKMLSGLAKPGGLHLAPDNPTKASFLDALEASAKVSINGMGMPFYSAMTTLCRELGVLISKYEKDFVADLTDLYDNPPNYSAPRRTSKSVNIEAPTLNILAAATPDALGDIIPESAWGQGLTSRIIFIYGAVPEKYRDMFARHKDSDMTELKEDLHRFFEELHGPFDWEPEAQDAIRHWFNVEKMAPVPTYGRLVNYCGRRNEHIMKLAMISAVSAGHGLTVTIEDFRRAQNWLFAAEATMPDVFRAMAQKSDSQLLQDCHFWLYTIYSKVAIRDRKAISEMVIAKWFEDKAPHEKIQSLSDAMEKTGRMRRGMSPGTWIPNPLDQIGSNEVNTAETQVATPIPQDGAIQ